MILRLDITESAAHDLSSIQSYLLGQSVEASRRVREKFDEAFLKLRARPRIGHRRDDLVAPPHLVYRVYSYLVIYRAEEGTLTIARVIHAARDVRSVLEQDSASIDP